MFDLQQSGFPQALQQAVPQWTHLSTDGMGGNKNLPDAQLSSALSDIHPVGSVQGPGISYTNATLFTSIQPQGPVQTHQFCQSHRKTLCCSPSHYWRAQCLSRLSHLPGHCRGLFLFCHHHTILATQQGMHTSQPSQICPRRKALCKCTWIHLPRLPFLSRAMWKQQDTSPSQGSLSN